MCLWLSSTLHMLLSITVVEDEEGVSKGYGFVRFMDEGERDRSLSEMSGAVGLGKKPLIIKPALAPKSK